ncbi:MAG: signal peptide peptidase SppA [Acetobacteraceae bacterium]|nr:signal peptide peptidase SppA [Acetobacteraceae bacterium]
MSLETDLLIDRRRLKRGLAFWRAAAIVAVLAAVALWAASEAGPARGLLGTYVARLTVQGTITEDRDRAAALAEIARDDRAKALIVVIDSPGGTVAGGEALHRAIARVAERKPVVAVLTGTAASAGYMVALPAERIFAREATVTGSIGVILQTAEVSTLLDRLGIRPETIASGPLKDQPSPFRPLSEEGRAALEAVVKDLHAQFVAMVAKGRKKSEQEVQALADGRVMTGRQALAAGLIDEIGGEAEARQWLASVKEVGLEHPVRDIAAPPAQRLLERILREAGKAFWDEWLRLDRGVLLWHGPTR